MRRALALVTSTLLAGCLNDVAEPPAGGPLATAFSDAAARTGVPKDVLLAVGYVETRFRTPVGDFDHVHHGRGERGLMGVVDRADQPWLQDAARGLGVDPELARTDPVANVHVAAAVLRGLAIAESGAVLPAHVHGWRKALARYGADADADLGDQYADQVLATIEIGASATAETGEVLVLRGTGAKAYLGGSFKAGQGLATDSSLAAEFLSARAGFFSNGRSAAIDRVVIHTTEGSYAGAISWFRSPNNPYQTSAHYVIRSSDGKITQMVQEDDTAHHVRSWNARSIGIEHEAFSADASWFTDEMYRASAALVRDICLRHGIPMDRAHIVGHNEAPGNDHSDPGAHWDWSYFMALVLDGDAAPPASPASPGSADPAAPVSSGFCTTHGGTWCDGDDVVVCSAGDEVSRTACADGCRSMPWGTPDECAAPAAGPSSDADDAPPADPCGGETFTGRCDADGTLIWCDAGVVQTYDCAAAGYGCGWQDDTIGNNCLVAAAPPSSEEAAPADPPPADPQTDACGGVTYEGTCHGDTVVWCESGALTSFDCASTSQTCGWDDSVGYDCVEAAAPPPPADGCGDVTYAGQCDGETLVWCDGGELYSYDCAITSQTCGWQDDTVGNNCL